MAIKIYTLENGVRLLTVFIKDFPMAISSFWVKAGSRKDPKGKNGLAHFFEHLLLVRTKKFPNRELRLQEIEKKGLFFNAYTSLETSNYYYIHPVNKTKQAIELLVDGFKNSILEKMNIDEERQIILDEERRNRIDPATYIWGLANRGLWPQSGLSSNILGTEKSINSISEDDVREFFKKFYFPTNTVFILINPNINELGEYKKIISTIPIVAGSILNHPDSLGRKKDIIFEPRNIDYAQLCFSFLTCSGLNTNEHIALEFIKNYLASGWISRLITRLRVKGNYTYWVSGENLNLEDTGYLRFTLSTDINKLKTVLDIFEEEIVLLKKKKIDHNLLKWHKNKYNSDLVRNSLNPEFLLSWYGWDLTAYNKKPLTIFEHLAEIDKLTLDKITESAQKYLKRENFSLALISPEKIVENIPRF